MRCWMFLGAEAIGRRTEGPGEEFFGRGVGGGEGGRKVLSMQSAEVKGGVLRETIAAMGWLFLAGDGLGTLLDLSVCLGACCCGGGGGRMACFPLELWSFFCFVLLCGEW